MDTINIKALGISTKIGVYDWEQVTDQKLLIDITLYMDCSNCAEDLKNTVDYADLCEKVTQFVESKSFQLIETVANEVAFLIKKQFKVTQVMVAVSKPHAVKNAGTIQVMVTR